MTTPNTITVEIRDNAHEMTPVIGWGWPDEALLADTTEMANRMKQAQRPNEDDPEYANLYFVS